jgi:ribonuclease-3
MRRSGNPTARTALPPGKQAAPKEPSRQKLERILGIHFKNTALLEEALTHKSYAMEGGGSRIPFNERLEFLGDSILSAAVAHYLFDRYPDVDEGRLSQLKSMLVSRPSLTLWGRDIGL